MYEQYIGQKLSEEEIFDRFAGMGVTGQPDSSQYPTIFITIEFIGTPEEAEAVFKRGGRCIHLGRPPRKGHGVIWNSKITLQELVGIWNTSVTADGGMSNETMVLKPDGSGIFAEANMGPYYSTRINWYVEDDILFINTDCGNICSSQIKYTPDMIVPCMSGKECHFTELSAGAHELPYYRTITNKTLAELEEETHKRYDELLKGCD